MSAQKMTTLATALAVMAGACSDSEPTQPEAVGSAEGYVVDGTSASPAPSFDGSAAAFSGMFQGTSQLEVYSEAEGWVAVGQAQAVQLQLQSTSEAPCGTSAQVPVGTYSRVRITFESAQTEISAGATLGGLVLGANVMLSLGASGPVTIEKEVQPFQVSAEATTEIRLDLNSEVWVTEESVTAETVTEAAIESAANVTIS